MVRFTGDGGSCATQERPRLTLVRGWAPGPEPASAGVDVLPDTERIVAGAVALLLAETSTREASEASFVLPLALSVCMEDYGVDADELVVAMRLVRGAVLDVAGLDGSTEPVPLGAGDPRAAAVSLARYLYGLVIRAARATGALPGAVASSAAAQLLAS
jgi:hypothetical protein